MKKLLLTSSFLYFTAVASPSLAVECTTVPSCSSLGYVDITSVSCDDGTFIKCPFDANYGICVKNSSEGSDPGGSGTTSECEVIAYGKTPAESATTARISTDDIANYCPSGKLCSYDPYGEALVDAEKISGIIIFSDKAINTASGATTTTIPSQFQAYLACTASEDTQDMYYPQFSTAPDDMFVECEAAQRYTVAYTVPTDSSGIENAIAKKCAIGLCPKSSIEAYVANKTGYVVTEDGMYELSSGATGNSVTTISSVKNIYYSCMTPCTAIQQLTLTGLTYPASVAHSYLYQKATAQCSNGLCPISTLRMAASSETGYMVAGEGIFKVNSGLIGSSLPSANVPTADSSKFYYACRDVATTYDAIGEETQQYNSPCTGLKVYNSYTTPAGVSTITENATKNCGGYLCSIINTGTILSEEDGYVVTAKGLYNLSSGTIGDEITSLINTSGKRIYFACSNARSALAQLRLTTVTYPANLTLGYIKEQARAKCPNGFADLFELESKVTTQTGYLFDSKCLSPVDNGVLSKVCVSEILAQSADEAKIYYSCQSVPTATATTVTYGSTSVVY